MIFTQQQKHTCTQAPSTIYYHIVGDFEGDVGVFSLSQQTKIVDDLCSNLTPWNLKIEPSNITNCIMCNI